MTDTQAPVAPPSTPSGWFTDPADASRLRWWNGTSWTEHVQVPPPQPTAEEFAAAQAVAAAAQQRAVEAAYVPFSHSWNAEQDAAVAESWHGSAQTLPGWFLAFAPLWIGGASAGVELALPFLPSLAKLSISLVFEIFIVLALANLDAKRLSARGFTPISAVWVLLLPVFFIKRTLRVGVPGLAAAVVSWLFSLVLVAAVVAAAFIPAYLAAQRAAQPATAPGTHTLVSISPEERAYELTQQGMQAALTKDVSSVAKVQIPTITCLPLADDNAGTTTSCTIAGVDPRDETIWVIVDPSNPYAAFRAGVNKVPSISSNPAP